MKEKIKSNLLVIYIIINALYLFICSYLCTIEKITYKTFGQTMKYASIINLIVCGLFIIYKKFIKKDFKLKIYDVFLILIAVFALISTHYAISKKVALSGSYLRYEGLYAILYYLTLTFLSSFLNHKQKKIVVYSIVCVGLFQAIYGYLQYQNAPFVNVILHGKTIWVTGLTTNPNFYGTIMLLVTSYLIGLFIDNDDLLEKGILIVGLIISLMGLLISNTLSALVGLIVVLLVSLIYCLKYKKYRKIGILLIVVVCETILLHKLEMTTLVNDLSQTKNEAIEISKGNLNNNYGTKRLGIWKKTMPIVPKHLLHGVGIDNFTYAFNGKPLIMGNKIYDKAHNGYLQILVTQGIFSLLSFLGLYIVAIVNGIKKGLKEKEVYLVLPIIGYLIQDFFNISVIEVTPFFFIALGLLINREKKTKSNA